MKYERLTKSGSEYITNDGEHDIIVELDKNRYETPQYDYDSICEKLNRLVELEDKIEQGTLIKFPIAYGTELHFLYSREHYGKPQPACVHSTRKWIFNIGYDGKMWFSVAGRGIGYYGDYTHELGKTVFLTREDAKKRLKELQE